MASHGRGWRSGVGSRGKKEVVDGAHEGASEDAEHSEEPFRAPPLSKELRSFSIHRNPDGPLFCSKDLRHFEHAAEEDGGMGYVPGCEDILVSIKENSAMGHSPLTFERTSRSNIAMKVKRPANFWRRVLQYVRTPPPLLLDRKERTYDDAHAAHFGDDRFIELIAILAHDAPFTHTGHDPW